MNGFLVDEQAVLLLAVVAEPLAVIRQQHNRRAIVQLLVCEMRDHPADDLVRVRDFAVVRRIFLEPLRRRVRLVRLVQMEKQEELRRGLAVQPPFGDCFRLAAVALQAADARFGSSRRHRSVEEIEALVDAGFLSQDERRHDATGREAAGAQQVGQHPLAGRHREAGVVADAGLEGQSSGQHRHVRRQRLRRVRIRALEHDAVARQPVDRGRLDVGVSVRRQMIRPQRVDGNQHDRPVGGRDGIRRASAGLREQQRDDRDAAKGVHGHRGRRSSAEISRRSFA